MSETLLLVSIFPGAALFVWLLYYALPAWWAARDREAWARPAGFITALEPSADGLVVHGELDPKHPGAAELLRQIRQGAVPLSVSYRRTNDGEAVPDGFHFLAPPAAPVRVIPLAFCDPAWDPDMAGVTVMVNGYVADSSTSPRREEPLGILNASNVTWLEEHTPAWLRPQGEGRSVLEEMARRGLQAGQMPPRVRDAVSVSERLLSADQLREMGGLNLAPGFGRAPKYLRPEAITEELFRLQRARLPEQTAPAEALLDGGGLLRELRDLRANPAMQKAMQCRCGPTWTPEQITEEIHRLHAQKAEALREKDAYEEKLRRIGELMRAEKGGPPTVHRAAELDAEWAQAHRDAMYDAYGPEAPSMHVPRTAEEEAHLAQRPFLQRDPARMEAAVQASGLTTPLADIPGALAALEDADWSLLGMPAFVEPEPSAGDTAPAGSDEP